MFCASHFSDCRLSRSLPPCTAFLHFKSSQLVDVDGGETHFMAAVLRSHSSSSKSYGSFCFFFGLTIRTTWVSRMMRTSRNNAATVECARPKAVTFVDPGNLPYSEHSNHNQGGRRWNASGSFQECLCRLEQTQRAAE